MTCSAAGTPRVRQGNSALGVVGAFRKRRCSDPLDKIYGILGMADAASRLTIRRNHNLTLRELYTKTILESILDTRGLNILSHVERGRTENLHLPSYVPDFTAALERRVANNLLQRACDLHLYSASRDSTAGMLSNADLEAITQIVAIDTIVNVSVKRSKNPGIDLLGEGRDFYSMLDSHPALAQAYWRTLCGGIVRDMSASRYRLVQDQDHAIFLKWQTFDRHTSDQTDSDVVLGFHMAHRKTRIGRLFAMTRSWYTCWVPEDIAKSDIIALMPGGRVPCILRKLADSDEQGINSSLNAERYQFIGDCYVDGIMHGEAWDERKLKKIILA